ncbi:class B sortase [Ruminococcus sp.]|uniref:class B sortase n=1 Tax=Ruminococcus sp. TaxID=41978 RepID=UPI0025ED7A2A|nr:class B sortase [Ruminococcus sp.]MBO4523816.1 class B sortase [Ruminococcus sp.]
MLRFWKKLNEFYGWLVIVFFGFIMLIGLWQCYDNYYIFEHSRNKDILKYKPKSHSIVSSSADAADNPITDEMVAWITIDGTNIDYPVMQGKDNTHFLNTDPCGEYSLTGSIFLDSRCSSDFSDEYSVIYGHHMDYGKMFGALDDFLNATYLESHSTGTLMLGRNGDKTYDLKVFASMRVSAREKTVFDMDNNRIRQFIRNNADVLTKESKSRIVALSTCADADSVTRIVVFCYIDC